MSKDSLEEEFHLSHTEQESYLKMTLKPKSKLTKQAISTIDIIFEKQNIHAIKILHSNQKDKTNLSFSQVEKRFSNE